MCELVSRKNYLILVVVTDGYRFTYTVWLSVVDSGLTQGYVLLTHSGDFMLPDFGEFS